MLRRIGESKLVKPICGIMLTSMILSFSVGILNASTRRMANSKQATFGVLPNTSGSQKEQTVPKSSQRTVNNPIAQVDSGANNQSKPNPSENPVTGNAITRENGTTWEPEKDFKTAPAKASQGKSRPEVDIYLLARVIHAESRGEPFEGQVAVGAVLMNRLKDSRFPKNLQQIIFKRGEFCTVRDGQIWQTPSQEAIKAARLAAAGWDPTGGALYFYNPAKTTSRWIWSRPVVNRIGNHIFAA